jgi:hypothetical protein
MCAVLRPGYIEYNGGSMRIVTGFAGTTPGVVLSGDLESVQFLHQRQNLSAMMLCSIAFVALGYRIITWKGGWQRAGI